MNITKCFLILTYVLCLYVNLHLTDRRTCACVFIDFLSHSEDPDERLVSTVCLDRNNLRGQKKYLNLLIQTMNPKILNGIIHANCICENSPLIVKS